jgi:putative endonuclease
MERYPSTCSPASFGERYIGVTSDLPGQIWQHREGIPSGFPARYAVYRLVYIEHFGDMELAIQREKQLKRWHRQWKINLIERDNPQWDDLAVGMGFERLPDFAKPRPMPSA